VPRRLLLGLLVLIPLLAAAEAPRAAEVDSLSLLQGRRAMWRSAALGGWGQATNGQWLKALFFSGAELSIVAGAVGQHREWRHWQQRRREASDPLMIDFTMRREDFYLRDRNKLIWWWMWVKLASVLDAYVSGSMSNFDAGWEERGSGSGWSLEPVVLATGTPGVGLAIRLP
jgi:hypothetical protein